MINVYCDDSFCFKSNYANHFFALVKNKKIAEVAALCNSCKAMTDFAENWIEIDKNKYVFFKFVIKL